MTLTINIPENDYRQPTEVREEVVQAICEAFLARTAGSVFHPYTQNCYRRASLMVVAHADGTWYGFHDKPFTNEKGILVHGCEMKAAFVALIKAGYHIFKHDNGCGWLTYEVYRKPYLNGYREVTEFTEFID